MFLFLTIDALLQRIKQGKISMDDLDYCLFFWQMPYNQDDLKKMFHENEDSLQIGKLIYHEAMQKVCDAKTQQRARFYQEKESNTSIISEFNTLMIENGIEPINFANTNKFSFPYINDVFFQRKIPIEVLW